MKKLFVQQDHFSRNLSLFIEEDRGEHVYSYSLGPEGIVVETVLDRNEFTPPKPFLSLSGRFGEEFIGLVAEYAASAKINTQTKDFTEGRLEATEKHLASAEATQSRLMDLLELGLKNHLND